jgi:hypothetical protein
MRILITTAALAVGMLTVVPESHARGGRRGGGHSGGGHSGTGRIIGNHSSDRHSTGNHSGIGSRITGSGQNGHGLGSSTHKDSQKIEQQNHHTGKRTGLQRSGGTGVKNYSATHGKTFSKGVYYSGKNHKQWTHQTYWGKHKCKCYWCPSAKGWFYWCGKRNCYLPTSCIDFAPPDGDEDGDDEDDEDDGILTIPAAPQGIGQAVPVNPGEDEDDDDEDDDDDDVPALTQGMSKTGPASPVPNAKAPLPIMPRASDDAKGPGKP